MTDSHSPRLLTVLLISAFAAVMGCDARIEQFEPNRVFSLTLATSRSTPTESASGDVDQTLRPCLAHRTSRDGRKNSLRAATRKGSSILVFFSEQQAQSAVPKMAPIKGCFREHCVVCHGLEGSGTGPASQFQDPYPRDFRFGVFKWKSTIRSAKPTKQDLLDLLTRGVPGTGMPSFSLLSPDDLDALVDYVIYLSVRGETERRLLVGAMDETRLRRIAS